MARRRVLTTAFVSAFPCRVGSYEQVGKCGSRGAVGAMIKLTCLVACVGFSAMPLVAQAQSYPVRSITVVVPFPSRRSERCRRTHRDRAYGANARPTDDH